MCSCTGVDGDVMCVMGPWFNDVIWTQSGQWDMRIPAPTTLLAATKHPLNRVHCNKAQTEKKHPMPQWGHSHMANPCKKWHLGKFNCLWSRCHFTNLKYKHKAVTAWQQAKRYHRDILETERAIISLLAAIMVEKGSWTPCDPRMCFKDCLVAFLWLYRNSSLLEQSVSALSTHIQSGFIQSLLASPTSLKEGSVH